MTRTITPQFVLTGLSAGAALMALAAAAANLIETAAQLLTVAFWIAVLAALVALDLKLHILSRREIRNAFLVSFAAAVPVSCAYWYATWWMPLDALPDAVAQQLVQHWHKLDLIPALFSLLLPSGWRSGLHQYFRSGTYCFPGPFWWESMRYLRTAIAGYTLAFFLAITIARLCARVTRRPWRNRV
jgi:hypothetical protein